MSLYFPGAEDPRLTFWPSFQTLTPGITVKIDSMLVTAHPAAHSPMTHPLTLRIECGGKVIAYSGDTGWNEFLPLTCRGADLFICEAFQYELGTGNHLDYLTILSHRHELDCRRIILTHLGETMLDAFCSIEFECASDGLLVEL
jgi:ribonuclease BN (tRNA processing enzyme)